MFKHEKLLILSDPAEMNCIIRLVIREVGAIILLMLLLSQRAFIIVPLVSYPLFGTFMFSFSL